MTVVGELNALLPGSGAATFEDTWSTLRHRVTVLNERAWEGRKKWPEVEAWLANFDGRSGTPAQVERLHALFLLSQFLFIGSAETRVLLQAMYRDLFLIPLIQEVRAVLGGSRDVAAVAAGVDEALHRTRFLGVGGASESGGHLLYLLRQESNLSKKHFIDNASIFATERRPDGTTSHALAHPDADRYVFIDDLCGSGKQVTSYSNDILRELVALNPKAKIQYLSILATAKGLEKVRRDSAFGDGCAAVFELDDTYQALSERARILHAAPAHIDGATLRKVARFYGDLLLPEHPTGYDADQLLLGFHHNTPDNTLPIIWFEGTPANPWTPAFRRHPKI